MRPEIKIGLLAGVGVVIVSAFFYVWYQNGRSDKPADVGWLKNREPNKPTTAAPGVKPTATPGTPSGAKPSTPVTPGKSSTTPPAPPSSSTPLTKPPFSPAPSTPNPSPTTTPPNPRPATPGTSTTPPVSPPAPSLPPLTRPATAEPNTTTVSPSAPSPSPSTTREPAPPPMPGGVPRPTELEPTRPTGPTAEPPAPARSTPPNEGALPRPSEPTRSTSGNPAKPDDSAAGAKTHVVASGDSLWTIAQDYYGDGHLWKKIKDANPDIDENRLLEGQKLVIPAKDAPAASAAKSKDKTAGANGNKKTDSKKGDARRGNEAQPATGDPNKPATAEKPTENGKKAKVRKATYRVESGDTLALIARNILKDGGRWREIYELNKDRIKDPDRLLVGTELRLPE